MVAIGTSQTQNEGKGRRSCSKKEHAKAKSGEVKTEVVFSDVNWRGKEPNIARSQSSFTLDLLEFHRTQNERSVEADLGLAT